MIRVHRDRKGSKDNPVRPDEQWFRLSKESTTQAIVEGSAHKVKEAVYRDFRVKAALEALFHQKCAYCETQIEGLEVDHFRPKGEVSEDPNHPGYYWLAYEWKNLYPACVFCNQRRYDQPVLGDMKKLPAAGKATQFPLASTGIRAWSPSADLDLEKPMLLDPCVDEPLENFSVNPFTGELLPKTERGEITCKIFNLNRRRVRKLRKQILQRLSGLLEQSQAPAIFQEIQNFSQDASPFAGSCRALIRDRGSD